MWPRWRATWRPGCSAASSAPAPSRIKVRYSDFTTITRSHTELPTQNGDRIERRAVGLLDRTEATSRPVRLLGVSVHNFVGAARVSALPEGWLPFEEEDQDGLRRGLGSIMTPCSKGSREAILRKVQPISIHGQLSYDVHYVFADEPDSPHVARVGPEAMDKRAAGRRPRDAGFPRRRGHCRSQSSGMTRTERGSCAVPGKPA